MSPVTSPQRSDSAAREHGVAAPLISDQGTTSVHEKQSGVLRLKRTPLVLSILVLVASACIAAAYLSRESWLPAVSNSWATAQAGHQHKEHSPAGAHEESDLADAHAGHEHTSGGDVTTLQLSEQARKNVGLELMTVQLEDFDRTVNVPAMVKERPGRTELTVSAPMTGIVTRIYLLRGEAVTPGQPLFDLRLTHKDLVDSQSVYLETLEQFDVINREVARLEKVTSSGALAGKRLLEREYEQQRTEARLHAQRQGLILHGLTQQQVEEIKADRELLQQVTIFAPEPVEAASTGSGKPVFQVSELEVSSGQHVEAGDPLCVLSDHAALHIEGKGFEEDSERLNEVANHGLPVTAVINADGKAKTTVPDLQILYVENAVEVESRALRFYVKLPNELVRDEHTNDGHRFIGWRFKPGQRVQLRVPVKRWNNRVVLPVDALVKEGAEWFVFIQHGDHFERQPVHVEYRDQQWGVLENDGSLLPGNVVVASGAYQMHLALKNKSGGDVDPHAGHNH
ncbi:MAG: efflux RND transporter periplasmic adaptor subunit [Planctomycetota bacterium]